MQENIVYLAPMEGVSDYPFRQILTQAGNFDACYSEFIRVVDTTLPQKTLLKEVPELENGGMTKALTPVRVQFLGDNPVSIKNSALRAVSLGAKAIDINFGCPSRFVHHAGSMLLLEPELMYEILSELRSALDSSIHLSAKIRAGFASKDELPKIINAIGKVQGLDEICIHARTRKELYQADALDLSIIEKISSLCPNIHLVANGDICSLTDAINAQELAKTNRLMIGRGAMMVPNIANVIKFKESPFSVDKILKCVYDFMNLLVSLNFMEKSVMDRAKQFLGFARKNNSYIQNFFKDFCKITSLTEAFAFLEQNITNIKEN